MFIAAEDQEFAALLPENNAIVGAKAATADLAFLGEAGRTVQRRFPRDEPEQQQAGDERAGSYPTAERFQDNRVAPVVPKELRHLERIELGGGEPEDEPRDDRADEEDEDQGER